MSYGRNNVIVTMQNGTKFSLAGYASDVQVKINEARGGGQLVPLELDRIPTGQRVWIDPDQVVSVVDS